MHKPHLYSASRLDLQHNWYKYPHNTKLEKNIMALVLQYCYNRVTQVTKPTATNKEKFAWYRIIWYELYMFSWTMHDLATWFSQDLKYAGFYHCVYLEGSHDSHTLDVW